MIEELKNRIDQNRTILNKLKNMKFKSGVSTRNRIIKHVEKQINEAEFKIMKIENSFQGAM